MWKGTVVTGFDGFPISFDIFWLAWTVFSQVKRTVAKETVEVFKSLMAGKIFTFYIFKKSITILHDKVPPGQ